MYGCIRAAKVVAFMPAEVRIKNSAIQRLPWELKPFGLLFLGRPKGPRLTWSTTMCTDGPLGLLSLNQIRPQPEHDLSLP